MPRGLLSVCPWRGDPTAIVHHSLKPRRGAYPGRSSLRTAIEPKFAPSSDERDVAGVQGRGLSIRGNDQLAGEHPKGFVATWTMRCSLEIRRDFNLPGTDVRLHPRGGNV